MENITIATNTDKSWRTNMEKLIEQKARELVEGVEQETPPQIKMELDTTKSYGEQAKEAIDFMATKNAIADEQLGDELTQKKKEELKTNAEANLQKERAKAKRVDVEMQNAEYDSFSGVASYAGIKKPLPKKMQKILFTILASIQTILLIIVSIPTCIVNITADAINSIVEKLSNIAKSARILVLSLLGLGSIAGAVYILSELLQKYNIIG